MTEQAVFHPLRQRMHDLYGVAPAEIQFIYAPYRICPLGSHIDHQLGAVTAMTINQGVHVAFAASGTREVRLGSLSFPGEVRFEVDRVPARIAGDWGNYARGAAAALAQWHALKQGILGVTHGAWGEGGLSSSSAVGVAYLLALEAVNELMLSPAENIRLDQVIENQYLGLNNGILDQSAILCSRKGHLTVIDCKAFAGESNASSAALPHGIELIGRPPQMPPFAILVVFSGLSQALITTSYNLRVQECAAAAQSLSKDGQPAATRLGAISEAQYAANRHRLSGAPARRAAHFFGEMRRVREGVAAWARGDLQKIGQLMNESGQSSIENYECGSPPLIDLCRITREIPGIYGARFSGAGFRGCCVALAKPQVAGSVGPEIVAAYGRLYPALAAAARTVVCTSDDQARVL